MATLSIHTSYRPLRIGFLVEEGNVEHLLQSASLNTAIWGGVYNPIIPVGGKPELTDRLIRLFRVDVLYPAAPLETLMKAFEKYSWLKWPDGFGRPRLLEESRGRWHLTVVDVLPLIRHYWDKEFKHGGESNCILPVWELGDPLHNLLVLLFGAYPTTLDRDYLKAYENGMRAQKAQLELGRSVPEDWAKRPGPLDVTRDRLLPDLVNYSIHDGVYVGHSQNFTDLVNFWNLRASGLHLFFWTTPADQRLKTFVSAFTHHLWNKVKKMGQFDRYLEIWASPDHDIESLRAETKEIVPEDGDRLFHHVDEHTWDGLNVKPPVYHFDYHGVLANLEAKSEGKYTVSFSLPAKPLPDELFQDKHRQQWIVSIRPLTEYGYDAFTLRPPFAPDLNEWFGRQISIIPWKFRVEREGLGLIESLSSDTVSLWPIRSVELVVRLFGSAGIEAKPSQPGRIADRLILQVGGLEGCRVFKIPGVRKLVESKEARHGVTRGRATEIIYDKEASGDPSFERHKGLFIEQREKINLDVHDVLDYLLKKSLLRTGLSLDCPNCTLDFWISIDSLNDSCRCEYCGHTFPIGPHLKDRGDWRFRLSGLFGRDDHQEGAIPVALTLLQLLRRHHGGETFLYTTALNLRGEGIDCETDLAVVERDRDGSAHVLVGECKGNLQIESADIDNMLKVKEALEKAGLQCFLLFSKTTAAFSETELAQFEKLRQQRVQMLLFTSKILEPYEPYWGDDIKDLVPRPYASTFEEMAQNSISMYLRGLNAPGGWADVLPRVADSF